MLGRRKEPEPERLEVVSTKVEVKPIMNEQVPTILSADTHFKGSLTFEKSLRIEGTFEGDITTNGTLYIGKEAKIKAEIKAGNVHVEGSITGNVTANEKIELRGTAKIYGDLKASKLVVEEGASLVGHCEISNTKGTEKESSYNKNLGEFLNKPPVEAVAVKK